MLGLGTALMHILCSPKFVSHTGGGKKRLKMLNEEEDQEDGWEHTELTRSVEQHVRLLFLTQFGFPLHKEVEEWISDHVNSDSLCFKDRKSVCCEDAIDRDIN